MFKSRQEAKAWWDAIERHLPHIAARVRAQRSAPFRRLMIQFRAIFGGEL